MIKWREIETAPIGDSVRIKHYQTNQEGAGHIADKASIGAAAKNGWLHWRPLEDQRVDQIAQTRRLQFA